MLQRAYSLLEIKGVDEDKRIIEGIATTPATDRMDDVVEPMGAEFALPLPFLWQHDARSPVGHVVRAKPTKAGIPVTIQMARTDEPGPVKDRLDAAWQDVKLGLVRGLSIGFQPLESSDIEGSWGRRFTKWSWLELSAVTIAANQEASITTIKSIDAELRAASGREQQGDQQDPARRFGPVKLIKPTPKRGDMNIQDQIKDFENTRAAKAGAMMALMEKAGASGSTLDAAQTEEYDGLAAEVEQVDAHLKRLAQMETLAVQKARRVDPAPGIQTGSENRGGGTSVIVRAEPKLEPGVRFARVVKVLGEAHRRHRDVELIAREMYPNDGLVQKTAVAAGTTISGNWAANLVGEETSVFADFVEYLRPMTILGKFGTDGIPGLRRISFRVPLISQTGGGDGYWVGQGKPKPLTAFNFARTTLEPLKVANIAVLTMESIRDSSPSSEIVVRDALAAALRERLDIDFIDPDKTADANVSPASITNGITPIPSSGTDADAVRADLQALLATFIAANNPPTSGVLIMSATTALALGLMRNALGQREFDSINMRGGSLEGFPVIVSEYVPTDDYTSLVVLVNASDIYLADEGGITVDASDQASLQMDDNPTTQDATTGTGTSLVSLWQTNCVGFRAERTINWARRRNSAVAYLEGVAWAP